MSVGKTRANEQLFDLLSSLVNEVESMTNEEEVDLRAKIEALRTEVTKVPSQSSRQLDEMEIAGELDRLSSKLEEVDEAIACTVTTEPEVKSLLSSTADIWMPVITATSEERREFVASVQDGEANKEEDYSTLNRYSFPQGFVFGASSSAYQYEGGWNEDGKTPSIWDTFTMQYPEKIADHSNAKIAEDFYHRYKEDVKRIKEIGLDAFRFSISWSRLLPRYVLRTSPRRFPSPKAVSSTVCSSRGAKIVPNCGFLRPKFSFVPPHLLVSNVAVEDNN